MRLGNILLSMAIAFLTVGLVYGSFGLVPLALSIAAVSAFFMSFFFSTNKFKIL